MTALSPGVTVAIIAGHWTGHTGVIVSGHSGMFWILLPHGERVLLWANELRIVKGAA